MRCSRSCPGSNAFFLPGILSMPWTPEDSRRHKKGLSARQRRQWARVANSALARCLREGRSQSSCEASAIRQANSVVGEPEVSTNLRRMTINTALTVRPSRLILHNRPFLSAPCVMIIEGVLNGGLVPGGSLVPEDWNGVPIVINHPLNAQGMAISARDPDVLAMAGAGHVFRVQHGTALRRGQSVLSLRGELLLEHCPGGNVGW